MKLKESLTPEGYVSVSLRYQDGTEVLHYSDDNLITKIGKLAILNSLMGVPNADDPITQLRAGSGGCIDPAGKIPREEDPNATGLVQPFIAVNVSYTINQGNLYAMVLADIDQSSANSKAVNEIGLFTRSGKMFNIKNFPSIPKTSEFSIHVEWKIQVL